LNAVTLDHPGRELAEPLRLAALVEVLHLPSPRWP
jgi:hypothetical protein